MEQLRIRDHIAIVTQNEVVLRDLRGGELRVLPAQITEVRELVGVVWKMTALPAIPNKVVSGPGFFTAHIKTNEVELRRTDDVAGNTGFKFPIQECDFVIDVIDLGLSKLKDIYALNPSPRGAATPSMPANFDTFEGRS